MTRSFLKWIGFAKLVFPLGVVVSSTLAFAATQNEREFQIGVAKIDITPSYPIRLTGYASRKTESEGVEQKLWAKALVIGSDREGALILLTVDNCGVCANVTEEVAARLKKKAGIARERFAICSSHTHTGPCIVGFAPNIFAMPIPDDQLATISRYTTELTAKLEQVALAALKDRRPGKLAWGQTTASFAANRRTAGGPVDHAVPVLRAMDRDGKLRAIVANYACHCTTLGGEFNKLCPDWAGYAQLDLERTHPGAVALVTIGCGADANPQPRGGADGGLAFSQQHGQSLATQVSALLTQPLTPLREKPICRTKRIELPFQPHFTREQWQQRATNSAIVGYHAQKYLARLDRGEKLPATLPYLVQTWTFGDGLAMVFLGGEVVVDYSLRLKREFDLQRLWINAYANDVPCYIPSKRILREGGYEAESSLWYYDRPQQLAPETEDLIVRTVHELLPKKFEADQKRSEFPPPKSPSEALASIRTKPGLEVELVAAEPLIVDPVAIDWSADGRLWVVEMRDYPMGMDGKWKPGGRVKVLEDLNGDGKFDLRDKATVFLDGIPFPTGVMAWRKGALVCAAPDILYAEDTDGDGKADVVKKLFSGFYTDNYQARVNSLQLGLDGWIYGANGLLGGVIHGTMSGREINIRGQDFRMNPDTGEFEAASGLTQQGRVRDDWGNWFGCDNSTLLRHYPLPDHYLRRNPHVAAPDPSVFVPNDADPNQLFPASHTLTRFNDPHTANRTTSACGFGIYRDELLGREFYGNAFVCEPVHNLVHRLVLETNGVTFTAHRAADEQHSEFLASTDNWFRPVQVRTGPDGALWVVDMYRFLIEHPRWIPADRLAQIDQRAGDDKGRIYRVFPRGKKLKPVRDLTKFSPPQLAAALDSSNGTERDRVQLHLSQHYDSETLPALDKIFTTSTNAAARLQALCAVGKISQIYPAEKLVAALRDTEPMIRANAVRLAEHFPMATPEAPALQSELAKLVNDTDARVRFQLALSLGQWGGLWTGKVLGMLVKEALSNKWMAAAVLSSATRSANELVDAVLSVPVTSSGWNEVFQGFVATVAGNRDRRPVEEMVNSILLYNKVADETSRMVALSKLLEAEARLLEGAEIQERLNNVWRLRRDKLSEIVRRAEATSMLALDQGSEKPEVNAALVLIGQAGVSSDNALSILVSNAVYSTAPGRRTAAFFALSRLGHGHTPKHLLQEWKHCSPATRMEAVRLLLSREGWAEDFMQGVETEIVAISEIPLVDRQRLLGHEQQSIRKLAVKYFSNAQPPSREAAQQKLRSGLAFTGDRARGNEVFAKNCATCHAVGNQGAAVGPDLAALRDKDGDYWLKNIIDPNAAIEPRFVAYNLELADGRSLSGIIQSESATSLTLNQSGGVRETILRSSIKELRAAKLSLMPEGLEQTMSPQDFADLIAYLKATPANFGSPPEEQAAQARKQFQAEGANGFMHLFFSSEKLPYASWLGTLTMPHCRQTDCQSKLIWQTRPVPYELRSGTFHRFRLPVAMGFISQVSGKFQLKLNNQLALEFDVTLNDAKWQSTDGTVRMTYTVMQNNQEDSNGVLEIEVSASRLQGGSPVTFEVIGSAANSQRWFGIYLL